MIGTIVTLKGGGPIKDPVFDAVVGVRRGVGTFVPNTLDLADETLLVRLAAFLHVLALGLQIGL